MPLAANLWITLASALVGAGVASLGLLVGFRQWRKNLEVERDKLDVERAKLAWDKEKAQQELVAEESEAEREYQERMLAAHEHADSLERRTLDYREAVVDTLRRLKILDMSQPLNLESLYVQVRVREEEPSLYVRPDETRRSREEPHAARPAETHMPEESLARYHRMAVVGDPGAGKTTMLKFLTFRMARGDLGPALPVYVELREFVDSGKERLLDYAAEHLLDHRYGFRDAGPYLEERLAAGRPGRRVHLPGGLPAQAGWPGDRTAAAPRAPRSVRRLTVYHSSRAPRTRPRRRRSC
ncbi:hypothetical protein [Nonomuraea sp. NPDC003709]|uniref:hypothetical protein n=1 Tax=Nonomuraea sp. NPDC003709 TaxID=3154450 RepID=UPI0033BDE584